MEYKYNNDYELIYLIKENDEDAFSFLLTKYKPLIEKKIYFLRNRLYNKNIDFDDIRQELIILFYDVVKKYSSNKESLFYSYFLFNLNNYVKDKLRFYYNDKRNHVLNALSFDYDDELNLYEIISDPLADTENEFSNNNIINYIQKYTYSLDIDNGIILEMYLSGYKIKDISNVLAANTNLISVRLNRIIKKIKKELEI